MPDENTVTLRTAYSWGCPNCKHHNFADGQIVPRDIVEEAMRDDMGLEEWEPIPEEEDAGVYVTVPNDVCCQKCKVTFFTNDGRKDDELHGN